MSSVSAARVGAERNMMATAATTPRGFSDEDLVSLMALIRGSDSVELKLTVPESDQRSAVGALGLDPLEAADPAGVLLRHARAGAERARARGPRPADPGQGRRLGREAAPGRARTSCPRRCGARRASASRSTRCPAASSARAG